MRLYSIARPGRLLPFDTITNQTDIDILPMGKPRGFQPSLVGFPASLSLAWFGFHRTGSYGLSTGEDG